MIARQYVFPEFGDDFASIAARELPGTPDAEHRLLAWNLHLAARAGLGRAGVPRRRADPAQAAPFADPPGLRSPDPTRATG